MIFKNLGGFLPKAEIGKTLSKPIIISETQWARLHRQLAKDNPSSVMLLREKMKVVLGFTVRWHREWTLEGLGQSQRTLEKKICLDFYNEPKRTMFLLKYSDFINQ